MLLLAFLPLAAAAQAKEVRLLQGQIGGFVEPQALAVDQGTHDIYALDGRNETQSIKVSATGGKFKLKFEGKTTKELAFNAPSGAVKTALEEIIACPSSSSFCLAPGGGGPGDASGSNPYIVEFFRGMSTTDVPQIECLNGTTPLSGGTPTSGCTVTTTVNGVNGSIIRYHADGTPAPFAALGTNQIDARKGPGGKPCGEEAPSCDVPTSPAAEGFHISQFASLAIDESGGPTKGDIYVSEFFGKAVYAFDQSGAYLGRLSEYEETPGNPATLKPLGLVCSLAVDGAGDLYLGQCGTKLISKYHPTANPVAATDTLANFSTAPKEAAGLAAGGGSGPESTAGSLFVEKYFGTLSKLDATSGALQYQIAENARPVTVDQTDGRLFAAINNPGQGPEVREYDASGASEAKLLNALTPASQLAGIAVDGTTGAGGTLYLSRQGSTQLDVYAPPVLAPDVTSEAADEVGASTATLNGTISAANGPAAHCSFQYTSDAAYLADKAIAGHDGFAGATSVSCSPAGPFTGNALNVVSAKASGLSFETKYRFRIVGENANTKNPSDDPGQVLSFETVGKPAIEGGEASQVTTTEATISAHVNPHGLPSSFAVQYVSAAQFEESGYSEATTTPAQALGDGILFQEASQLLSGLQADTAYHFRIVAENEAGQAIGKDAVFATYVQPSGLPEERAWELVSPAQKLGEVFVPEPQRNTGQGGTCNGCTPGWELKASPRMPMQPSTDGSAMAYEGNPFFTGLASGANEYVASRSSGGWTTAGLSGPQFSGVFKAFSADLGRGVLYQIEPPLSPQAPAGFADLYLWQTGGALAPLVTSAPPQRSPGSREKVPNAFQVTFAGANAGSASDPPLTHIAFEANDALTKAEPGIAPQAPAVGAEETDLYEWSEGELHLVNVLPGNNATAANAAIGSGRLLSPEGDENLVVDHAVSADGGRIFWSKLPSGQLYVREGGTKTIEVPDPGKFIAATPSGSEVLLSDGKVYDLESQTLTDLTGGAGGFLGLAGASEDLSRVYFLDEKALTPPSERNANGEGALEGKPNLYLAEAGTRSFVARLLPSDNVAGSSGELGVWHPSPSDRLAQTSADGRYLAFESQAPLSDYDNKIQGNEIAFEVYEYDALAGSLTCVSCNPTARRPLGLSNLTVINSANEAFPYPENLPSKGEGRLFFESQDALSLADQNGPITDVYEYRPTDVGGCERAKGCLDLISSGQGASDFHFVSATPSGSDVFFASRPPLVPEDQDDLYDLYDARVGGGFEPIVEEPCEAEACKGPAGPTPEFPTPTTSTFSGEEPPPPRPRCRKGKVRRHGRCVRVRKHHRRAARQHAKGASR